MFSTKTFKTEKLLFSFASPVKTPPLLVCDDNILSPQETHHIQEVNPPPHWQLKCKLIAVMRFSCSERVFFFPLWVVVLNLSAAILIWRLRFSQWCVFSLVAPVDDFKMDKKLFPDPWSYPVLPTVQHHGYSSKSGWQLQDTKWAHW